MIEKRISVQIPGTEIEAEAIKKYCTENGLILGQVIRRLILKEIQEKSVILSADYIPPNTSECLIEKRRK